MAKSVKQPVEAPPYLKQVRIRDYRSIRDAKVDFKPGLNIIIGENGAGKTNLVALTSSLIQPFEDAILAEGCELIVQGKEKFSILFQERLESAERGKRISRLLPYVLVRVDDSKPLQASYLMEAFEQLVEDEPFYEVLNVRYGIPVGLLPIVYEPSNLTLPKQGTLKLEKSSTHISFEKRSFFVMKMLEAIEDAIQAANYYAKAEGDRISIEEVKQAVEDGIQSQLVHISGSLNSYSPIQAVRRSESLQVYFNAKQEEYIINGVALEYQVDNNWLPFAALSDGTKRAFYIISELSVSSFTTVDRNENGLELDFGEGPKIIFLEEPELGIHPAQLTKLLNLIREVSREHQVIMTTHSPQVLDMLTEKELDRITVCTLDPKKGTQFHKLSRTKQQQAREYMKEVGFLSDYWRYSFLEETEAE